jgi:hypothetical protein
MTEEKIICQTYSEMAQVLRECKAKGLVYWWNHDELMNGELIVYVRKEEDNG